MPDLEGGGGGGLLRIVALNVGDGGFLLGQAYRLMDSPSSLFVRFIAYL